MLYRDTKFCSLTMGHEIVSSHLGLCIFAMGFKSALYGLARKSIMKVASLAC